MRGEEEPGSCLVGIGSTAGRRLKEEGFGETKPILAMLACLFESMGAEIV